MVVKNLIEQGFHVTKLASSGGFLKAGNVTFICGVCNERVDACLSLIEKTCKAKVYSSKSITPEGSSLLTQNINGSSLMPNEIVFGGATVFVLNIENHKKY
jgi:uncharacterized protein YaaQ